jgi:hypothetical protein
VHLRSTPQDRFWGKVRNDRVAKIAPAGKPKSDCAIRQTEKCGATVAAAVHWKPQVCAEAAMRTAMVTEKFTATEIEGEAFAENRPPGELQ